MNTFAGPSISRTRAITVIISLALLASAGCAPAAERSAAQTTQGQVAPAAPKILRLGIITDAEPKEGGVVYGGGAGGSEPKYIFHAGLTVYDEAANLQPRVAETVPTIEGGDWKVLPSGQMQVTWKLRRDVVWHDGTPLTANAFLLGMKFGADPNMKFTRGGGVIRQIEGMTAPDDHTLVMTWKNVYIYANDLGLEVLPPLHPKFEALYASADPDAIAASPYWAEEWIGLGPHKVIGWTRGSQMEGEAFGQYFLGQPRFDRIIIRFIGDTNALIVQATAGELDVVPVGSLKEDEAFNLQSQMGDKGAIALSQNKLRNGFWQWRDPTAPWLQDPKVRQALIRMIDRPSLVNIVQHGLSEVDDIMIPRRDPAYQLAKQQGLPDLSFNVDAAHRLMAESGFARGADGIYHGSDGRPFDVTLTVTGDIQSNVQQLLVIEDQWKQAGLQPAVNIVPSKGQKDEQYSNTAGIVFTSSTLGYESFEDFLTSEISTEQKKWKGSNPGGFSDPGYDASYSKLMSTLNAGERNRLAAGMVKYVLDRALYVPISYSSDVSATRKGVHGVTTVLPLQRVTSWNIHLWNADA
jgi:peptide/nickel transport system substrate-binding protein